MRELREGKKSQRCEKCRREWAAKAASSSCHCSTEKREIE